MIFAIIPAAGKSQRMGRAKLALPLGDRTILEHVVCALRAAGVETILVVVGPHVPELGPLAAHAGAQVLQLDEVTFDMRATVEHGLQWAEEHLRPTDSDAWLLAPADHPTLEADAIRQIITAWRGHPGASIFVPTHNGVRGHPSLIGWKHVVKIRSLSAGTGLNAYLRQNPDQTMDVPVSSSGVLTDLDTPEDYNRLREL